jgi:hypothetical protein
MKWPCLGGVPCNKIIIIIIKKKKKTRMDCKSRGLCYMFSCPDSFHLWCLHQHRYAANPKLYVMESSVD